MERSSRKDPELMQIRRPKEAEGDPPVGEVSLVSAFALIWRVICGRRYAIPEADVPDIAQEAVLRLWKWREKYREKAEELTITEWDSFTAKTAHNEINRFLANRIRTGEVPLGEASQIPVRPSDGNTNAEIVSLVANVWQGICRLSLYQRRALLLSSPELLIYFIKFGISALAIVESLELSSEEWRDISGRLPLSDTEIAAIARSPKKSSDRASGARAIKKARFDARRKLGRLRK